MPTTTSPFFPASVRRPAPAVRDSPRRRYGAVSAPSWVLPAGAVLAIATALLPIALQSGDEAQREMAEEAKDSWGKSSNKDTLKRRV